MVGSRLAVLHRALERQNVVAAEIAARELGTITLLEALELTALIAKRDPRVRGRRAGARWLQRWLAEARRPTIDDAVKVAGLLAALGGTGHAPASQLYVMSCGARGYPVAVHASPRR